MARLLLSEWIIVRCNITTRVPVYLRIISVIVIYFVRGRDFFIPTAV